MVMGSSVAKRFQQYCRTLVDIKKLHYLETIFILSVLISIDEMPSATA